jgi:hypothetical protein
VCDRGNLVDEETIARAGLHSQIIIIIIIIIIKVK